MPILHVEISAVFDAENEGYVWSIVCTGGSVGISGFTFAFTEHLSTPTQKRIMCIALANLTLFIFHTVLQADR